MALFGNKDDKEAKQAAKEQAVLDKYGLGSLSDPDDIKSVRSIATELAGTGLTEIGSMLSQNEKAMLQTQMRYQRALVEQNFVIIRQLDRIARSEKLIAQLLSKK